MLRSGPVLVLFYLRCNHFSLEFLTQNLKGLNLSLPISSSVQALKTTLSHILYAVVSEVSKPCFFVSNNVSITIYRAPHNKVPILIFE